MKRIRPKNWHDFQHYKDRAPVWIKLHKRLLDDFEFNSLPVASRALAPMLWLLASEYDEGDIPADTRKIAYRLRMTLEELAAAFQPLLSVGFFEVIGDKGEDASDTLAELEPCATPEKETQVTSNKRETEKKRARGRVVSEPIPDWIPLQAWSSFVQMRRTLRAPLTDHGARLAIAELEKLRDEGHDPTKVLEQSVMNSWRGLFPIGAKNERGNRAPREGRGIRDGAEHALAAIRRSEGENERQSEAGNAARGLPAPSTESAPASTRASRNAGTDHPPTDHPRRDISKLCHDDGGEEFEISHVLRRPRPPNGTAIATGLQAVSDQSREQILSDAGAIACARMKGIA